MTNSEGRCTGQCCEKFSIPVSPLQLQHEAKKAKLGKSRFPAEEILKIAEMVIFLGNADQGTPHESVRGLVKRKPVSWDYISKQGGRQYMYTCKYWDKASGNCTNYENRPDMCRNYPDKGTCGYRGCTSPCATKNKACVVAGTELAKESKND